MSLIETAQAWHDQDPDEATRAELATLIRAAETGDAQGTVELGRRFDARLEFGTAGLRGELGAGSNRMNRVLVAQAAAGFAAYLLEQHDGPGVPSVVVGYDGRQNSEVFARDTAELMAGAGVRAILLPRLLPTPVLAFAVRHLDVSAGVMVTRVTTRPATTATRSTWAVCTTARRSSRPPTPASRRTSPASPPRPTCSSCRARPGSRPPEKT